MKGGLLIRKARGVGVEVPSDILPARSEVRVHEDRQEKQVSFSAISKARRSS